MTTLNSIADFLGITTTPTDTTFYVKGYYGANDGGGGIFVYDPTSTASPNLGTIFQNPAFPGRFIRQYEGHIDVRYFGVWKWINNIEQPPGTITNTDRIQNAIDYTLSTSPNNSLYQSILPYDLTIFFPDGNYFIDKKIILKNGTHIKGDTGTLFTVSSQASYDYMFEIAPGPVERAIFENITMDLGGKAKSIGGFHIKAQASTAQNTGGLWASTFRNIKILAAGRHGIWLEGGDTAEANGYFGNQYLLFENVWIERIKTTQQDQLNGNLVNCLRMTGQSNINTFINCQFAIPWTSEVSATDYGTNIYITSNSGDPLNNNLALNFINCATGGSSVAGVRFGFDIVNAENVTIQDSWIEDTDFGISVKTSDNVNILDCRFANAAGCGGMPYSSVDHVGACVRVIESTVNVERNYVLISGDTTGDPYANTTILARLRKSRFILGSDNNTINVANNSFANVILSESYGISQYLKIKDVKAINYSSYPTGPTLEGIDADGKKLLLVKAGGTNTIKRINSQIAAGEFLVIRAEEADITFYQWDPALDTGGRNLWLSGNPTVVLRAGHAATFVKVDGIHPKKVELCSYQLLSIY